MKSATDLLGKWYAKEPTRYYQILGKSVDAYKMYITSVDVMNEKFTYDSFLLVNGKVEQSKIDKTGDIIDLVNEIDLGALVRSRP